MPELELYTKLKLYTQFRNDVILYRSVIEQYIKQVDTSGKNFSLKTESVLNQAFKRWYLSLITLDVVRDRLLSDIPNDEILNRLSELETLDLLNRFFQKAEDVLTQKIEDLLLEIKSAENKILEEREGNKEIEAEESEQKEKIESSNNEQQIRDAKHELLEENKNAFLRYCALHGIKLDSADISALSHVSFISSIIHTKDPNQFARLLVLTPRIKDKIGTDEIAISFLETYVAQNAQELQESRSTEKLIDAETNQNTAQEAINDIGVMSRQFQRYGFNPEVVEHVFTSSSKEIRELEENETDKQKISGLEASRKVREEFIRTLWENDEKLRQQMFEDLEITPISRPNGSTSLPQTFEEFLGSVDERSVLDLVGSTPQEIETNEESAQQNQGQVVRSQGRELSRTGSANKKNQRQLESFKKMTGVGRRIATNPVVMGGIGAVGGAAGVAIYGMLSQGIAAGIGAGAFGLAGGVAGAIAGAEVGATLGSFVPVVGNIVGGAIGALIGGIGGAVAAGGGSLVISIGGHSLAYDAGAPIAKAIGIDPDLFKIAIKAPSVPTLPVGTAQAASKLAAGTLTNASSTLGSTAFQGGAQLAGTAGNSALTLGKGLLSSIIQGASTGGIFSSGAVMGTVIASPLVVAGVASVIAVSTIMGTYLGPTQITTGSESQYVTLTKTASQTHFENSDLTTPKTVTYTITITPKNDPSTKNPYTIHVVNASDTFSIISASKPTPATPQDPNVSHLIGPIASGSATISYPITLNSGYANTAITNTVIVDFTVDGVVGGQKALTTESVTVGTPPSNFWPAGGVITALDTYRDGSPHAVWIGGAIPSWVPVLGGHNFGHYGHAIDITATGNVAGGDVVSPFSGKAIAIPLGSTGAYQNIGYGNHIWLATDQGFVVIFAHLQDWSSRFKNQDGSLKQTPVDISVNDCLGKVDSTGNSSANHLHYEVIGNKPDGSPMLQGDIAPPGPALTFGETITSPGCRSDDR